MLGVSIPLSKTSSPSSAYPNLGEVIGELEGEREFRSTGGPSLPGLAAKEDEVGVKAENPLDCWLALRVGADAGVFLSDCRRVMGVDSTCFIPGLNLVFASLLFDLQRCQAVRIFEPNRNNTVKMTRGK
jgi:hypothetical protein